MSGANIKLVEVSKTYKEKYVVKDVCMDINEGDFLTILGPSGAGKTTVLRMIAGFVNPTEGKILLDDRNIAHTPSHKRNIGMLFQNYALFPHMNVYSNIQFPLSIRKYSSNAREKAIREMLEKVRMTGYENRFPRELSGGQQQRVGLARALVYSPPLLLLDEPMAALDKQLRKHMQLEIKQLHDELGITTISVTHDQEEALTMATKVCVMQDGKVAQIASPREIYERPRNVFVAKFIGDANILSGRVAQKVNDVVSVRLSGGSLVEIFDDRIVYFQDDEVSIVIRPEKIRLVSESWEGFKVAGVIKRVVYAGESLKISVETEMKELLSVKLFTTSSLSVQTGDRVTLGVDPKDMVLISNRFGNG